MDSKTLWVARDKDKKLKLFGSRPFIVEDKLCVSTNNGVPIFGFNSETDFIYLDSELFPNLEWEDEPKEVFLNTGYDMAEQINHVWSMLKCTQEELNKANEKAMYYATKYEAIKKIVNEH